MTSSVVESDAGRKERDDLEHGGISSMPILRRRAIALPISPSTSHTDHTLAAKLLSEKSVVAYLLALGQTPIPHLDEGQNMMAIRDRLEEIDGHFTIAGVKLFFVQQPDPQFRNEELERKSKGNVLIETLIAGELGLPTVAGPTYEVPSHGIRILHPTILILTKLKRWCSDRSSTRPKTISKNRIDRNDITFMITFLAQNSLKIEFNDYTGKPKEELLKMVATFHAKLVDGGEDGTLTKLQVVMYPEDWEVMKALPVVEEEDLTPPVD
ncbi:hypothetical protein BDY19DRAFT_992680 [Irpex rosettiformis]|uniref:Uncharacterized protein n=1 Tax=Irpex rosettiformis TaxID=378272 RepID=A0ACB8U671_9APHY|nr:hypothetical protein BDY19DRAFT_992680 [Irpex rosettiformis]